jgi:hypothetical protein
MPWLWERQPGSNLARVAGGRAGCLCYLIKQPQIRPATAPTAAGAKTQGQRTGKKIAAIAITGETTTSAATAPSPAKTGYCSPSKLTMSLSFRKLLNPLGERRLPLLTAHRLGLFLGASAAAKFELIYVLDDGNQRAGQDQQGVPRRAVRDVDKQQRPDQAD